MAISPQNPDESLNMQQKNNLEFEVLSDAGNKVAAKYTSINRKSDDYVKAVDGFGKNFNDHYDSNSQEVPVPAVFIIDQDGTVLFAKSEGGDFTERVEAKEIINALS